MTPARPHSANLDRLRVVAIVDIVLYHVNYYEPRYLLGMGLPTFLVTATMLGAQHREPRPWRQVIVPRWRRIMLPWLFWSGVFGVGLLLREILFNEWRAWHKPFEWMMLTYGTAIHLWFLPWIFLAGLAVRGLQGLTRASPWPAVAWPGLALGLGWAAFHSPAAWPFPFETWWFALPCIPLGLALARLSVEGQLQRRAAGVAAAVLLAASVALLLAQGLAPPIGRFGLAVALIALAFVWPGRADPITAALSGMIYGVFLIHPLVLLIVHDLVDQPSNALLSWCGVVGSAAIVAGLRRTAVRRFV